MIDKILREWARMKHFHPECGVRETRLVMHRGFPHDILEMIALTDDGRELRATVPCSLPLNPEAVLLQLRHSVLDATKQIGAQLWDTLVIQPDEWAPQA